MAYFPFFIDLTGKKGLIAGGGTVALRKVEKLLPYGPDLTVTAPQIHPELSSIPGLTLCMHPFCPEDLEGVFFVIAATDDRTLNHSIAALCRERSIPVNVVDDKEACTFLFPALVQKGALSVGISTGGASPTAAIWLKEQISDLLPHNLDAILAWLEEQRPVLKARFLDETERSHQFARLFAAAMEAGRPLNGQEQEALFHA